VTPAALIACTASATARYALRMATKRSGDTGTRRGCSLATTRSARLVFVARKPRAVDVQLLGASQLIKDIAFHPARRRQRSQPAQRRGGQPSINYHRFGLYLFVLCGMRSRSSARTRCTSCRTPGIPGLRCAGRPAAGAV
jgi:hypothetical protein